MDASPHDAKSPLNIFLSLPERFDSILSFSDQNTLAQLLRCCKSLYGAVARDLYIHVTVTPDNYHLIFSGASTRRNNSKRELLLNTRSITVNPENWLNTPFLMEQIPEYLDYKSVQGLMPNLQNLSWLVSDRLPELAFSSALDSLIIRTSAGLHLPTSHKHITLLPRQAQQYFYNDMSTAHVKFPTRTRRKGYLPSSSP